MKIATPARLQNKPAVKFIQIIEKDVTIGQIIACTKPRTDSMGRNNIGILIKDVESKGQFWINHYTQYRNPLKFGDYVRFVDEMNIVKIPARDAIDLDF